MITDNIKTTGEVCEVISSYNPKMSALFKDMQERIASLEGRVQLLSQAHNKQVIKCNGLENRLVNEAIT